ncbi:MAG: hypothetical protein ACOCYQ_07815, partial [Alkalispirochaeta sp.]
MAPIGTVTFGLVHSAGDAHVLGITALAQLLGECGVRCAIADGEVCRAFSTLDDRDSRVAAERWLREVGATWLGLSYRLDPAEGVCFCDDVFRFLRGTGLWGYRTRERTLVARGGSPGRGDVHPAGRIEKVFFAGLPETCRAVTRRFPEIAGVFPGDETPAQTLRILGINPSVLPAQTTAALGYDEDRLAFGREVVQRELHLRVAPPGRRNYPEYGTDDDGVERRILAIRRDDAPPVIRAHLGPYLGPGPEATAKAVQLFLEWTRRLASGGYLDVLSIGSSQLSQEAFGEAWGTRPNGGGVPVNSPDEYRAIHRAAQPMLVRTYAGTRNVPALARVYEETLHIAWHALSLWWFCRIDGRGPNTVREKLREHLETLRYIAGT